jgi:hypothetical protein
MLAALKVKAAQGDTVGLSLLPAAGMAKVRSIKKPRLLSGGAG